MHLHCTTDSKVPHGLRLACAAAMAAVFMFVVVVGLAFLAVGAWAGWHALHGVVFAWTHYGHVLPTWSGAWAIAKAVMASLGWLLLAIFAFNTTWLLLVPGNIRTSTMR